MRVTRHNTPSWSATRYVCLAGAMAMALSLAGCSAASMTGFEFPVFGLTKKSSDDNGAPSDPESVVRYPANPETLEQRPLSQ